jgi:hypothetical protein
LIRKKHLIWSRVLEYFYFYQYDILRMSRQTHWNLNKRRRDCPPNVNQPNDSRIKSPGPKGIKLSNVTKLFTAAIFEVLQEARVFTPGPA